MKSRLTTILPAIMLAMAGFAHGQQAKPSNLEPLPEVPPPPQMAIDPAAEPEVRIIRRGEDKVEEFRANGKLYMVRITPPNGTPYVLVDNSGNGDFSAPTQGPADAHRLSVPMWVIKKF